MFLAVALVRFVSRWKLVRFGVMWSGRLGHLVGNTECYLSERDVGLHPNAIDFWIPHGESNRTIEKKYSEVLNVLPRCLARFAHLVVTVNGFYRGSPKHRVDSQQVDRDIYNLWKRPHLEITPEDEIKGRALLQSLGVPPGAKWVCLFTRDRAYLDAKHPENDWSYHDYRNSDIDDCCQAAVALRDRRYYVLRMGQLVAKPFNCGGHIIDYSQIRTDFGDFYLAARCEFFLGASSGLMTIAQVFQRPVAVINYVPIGYMPTYSDGLCIWKHHIKDSKRLSVSEIFDAGVGLCTTAQGFERAGITLIDNTPQEITDLAMEMADTIGGFNKAEDQSWFWDKFPKDECKANDRPLHGEYKLRIGREFLKGYQ